MMNHAAVLDALIMAASNDFPLTDQHGADRDAAGGQAFFGFVNGRLQEWIAHENGYFRDEGLNVELKFFPTGVAQKAPLVSGQIAVGVASVQVWMTMRAAGAPILLVSDDFAKLAA